MSRGHTWKRRISSRIAEDSLAHAYLISGPRGIGKSDAAIWIAKAAICSKGPEPCGCCDSCRGFDSAADLDLRIVRPVDRPGWVPREFFDGLSAEAITDLLAALVEKGFLAPPVPEVAGRLRLPIKLNPASIFKKGRGGERMDRKAFAARTERAKLDDGGQRVVNKLFSTSFSIDWYPSVIGIGQLRGDSKQGSAGSGVIRFLSRRPAARPRKVVIIEEAERMTEQAQNSLLKTLEEPPADSLLLLTTSRREGLVDTIRSRCEEVRLVPVGDEEVSAELGRYFESLEDDDRKELVRYAEGVPGRAAALDLAQYRARRESAEHLLQAAGDRSFDLFFERLERWAQEIASDSVDPLAAARENLMIVLVWARDNMVSGEISRGCADRVFRAAHAAHRSVAPKANLILLLEEFGVSLWKEMRVGAKGQG